MICAQDCGIITKKWLDLYLVRSRGEEESNMVYLEKVSEKTFRTVVKMKVGPEQENFVASNVMSLAQAWIHYEKAKPYAIMDDEKVVGFTMLDWDEEERTAGIWRFMIGLEEQKKGYGRAALTQLLKMIRETDKFDLVYLDYAEGNTVARELYYSCGFRETGEVDDDEVIMELPLTDQPKVGMLTADEDDMDDFLELIQEEQDLGTIIPKSFVIKEQLEEAIKQEQVKRLTIMGNTIGLYLNDELLLGKKYLNYLDEVKGKIEDN